MPYCGIFKWSAIFKRSVFDSIEVFDIAIATNGNLRDIIDLRMTKRMNYLVIALGVKDFTKLIDVFRGKILIFKQ
jgi:hypothetical protein